MADQLIACESLSGMSRSRVRALLGRPYPEDERHMYYELGAGRAGGPLDNEFRRVQFDRRSRVEAVDLVGF
jgi:hypothetical protein